MASPARSTRRSGSRARSARRNRRRTPDGSSAARCAARPGPRAGNAPGWTIPEAVENAAREYLPGSPEAAAWAGWGTALKPAIEPIVLARKPLAAGSIPRQHLATGTGGLNIAAAKIPGRVEDGRAEPDRWPANVVTDGSAEVLGRFPVDGEGSVARFFYSGKADAADRRGSDHPTVKPHSLMRWLVRLVTPRGGLVLDPFGGSGATAWAAEAEGRRCVLIEREPKHAEHIAQVLAAAPPRRRPRPRPRPARRNSRFSEVPPCRR